MFYISSDLIMNPIYVILYHEVYHISGLLNTFLFSFTNINFSLKVDYLLLLFFFKISFWDFCLYILGSVIFIGP